MTTWTQGSKSNTSFSNETKNASSWSNAGKTVTSFVLLIDNTFKLLIDDTYFLELGGSSSTAWNNEVKS